MNRNEIIDLLTLIAGFDQRTVGEGDIAAWFAVAESEGWTWLLAQRVAIDYHRSGGDKPRIRPAHVTDAIAAARKSIRATLFRVDITPPPELADDPRAEIAWRREYTRAATEQALDDWARTGQFPDALPDRPAVEAVPRAELAAAVDRFARDFAARRAVR